jgi:hypothetical protein
MTAADALIGHTGFVGGTLARSYRFARSFNSTNVAEMTGGQFGLVICAGVSAEKWRANADPKTDAARIRGLTDVLDTVTADEFILISTIDVYDDPAAGGDEATLPNIAANHAYGKHRYQLEEWCRRRFPCCRVVRLPALFGTGLRKNALYDLMHDHQTEKLNPAGCFQWYGLHRLWRDIGIARSARIETINLFPEPVELSRIIEACIPGVLTGPARLPAPRYRVETRHAGRFGGDRGFIADSGRSLNEIAAYVAACRAEKV